MTMSPAQHAADKDEIRATVAARYADLARAARSGQQITDCDDILAEDRITAAQRLEGGRAGCIAGAPSFAEYRAGLAAAGFTGITITATHQVADGVHSAIIRAARP
jgi:arsenite methyltransferase